MLGRSACYRMAAPAPLVLAQAWQEQRNLVSAAEARRGLDAVWQYFITHGAVCKGTVTQGYFESDPRLLEDYSGPASCLWSLRSLVAAFALPDSHAFWQADPAPLPVEQGDYRVPIAPTAWTVVGDRASSTVRIETGQPDEPALEGFSPFDRLIGWFSRHPRRPKNIAAKYQRAHYDSASPYGLDERHAP